MQKTDNMLKTISKGLTDCTREVFEEVSKLECIKDLFLCGGTAQSIQLGHRLSEDLDFELLGIKRDRPKLDISSILNEIKENFPQAREEILGEDHFLLFINKGKVKLSFFRPENPVKKLTIGLQYNNLRVPTLQELLGMKVYTICLRSVFRDYYDIFCLLENGCNIEESISYASYLSRHTIKSKAIYTRLLSPQLYKKDADFNKMHPIYDISAEEIGARIKLALEK